MTTHPTDTAPLPETGPVKRRRAERTVVFLSYFRHQARLFGLIARALPPEIASRQLNVYALTTWAILDQVLGRDGLPPEVADRITHFECLKRACRRPGADVGEHRKRLAPEAGKWYHLLRRRLAGADLLVVWSGFRVPLRAAACAAESLGIRTLYCENGVLPGTLMMDPKGVNYAGSIVGKGPDFFLQAAIDPEREQALFDTGLQQRPLRRALRGGGGETDDGRPLPERYVLFPMQVHDDSQVLVFSPRFRTMEDTVRYVAAQVAVHNAGTGDSLALVVKEHPSDLGRADYRPLRRSLPGAYFMRRTPVGDLIRSARAVVTLNSSVGVEALLLMRPVITLGEALYNGPGVVSHIGDGDLAEALGAVIDQPVNRELVTRFLCFLRYEYLVPVSWRTANETTIQPAAQRIVDVLHDRLAWAQ